MDAQHIFRKTRIAPTPSGFLHLGNVLSFAIAAALARKTKAKILLRIDDLDRERVNRKYVQDIFDTLNYLEIPWDEGPGDYQEYEKEYSQLHRMDLYLKALQQLKETGNVFACDCSRANVVKINQDGVYPGTCRYKNIPLDEANISWRLCTTADKELTIQTLSGTTIKTILPPSMKEFIVRKKDGFPAYQLTSVLDDEYFEVDLIIRGEDLWPSTLAQQYLSGLLHNSTFQHSTFYHHQLLPDAAGRKLSKSAGATSVQFLRKEGKKPQDIYSLIAHLLGHKMPVRDFKALQEIVN